MWFNGGAIIEDAPTEASITKARNTLHIPETQTVLLSIGHLGEIKGHQDTITALASVINEQQNIHLYIAGDGSETEKKHVINVSRKAATAKPYYFF